VSRAFYSLPDPKEVGLKWKPYQQAREKVSRIERRLRETQAERERIEAETRELDHAETRALADAVLKGEADPEARHGAHEKLAKRIADLGRELEAVNQALGLAEEELRITVFENQDRWKAEADKALEKALKEEHEAYAKALELIEGPRSRRVYLQELSGWIRYLVPNFNPPSDVAGRSAIAQLQGDATFAEEKMHERLAQERQQAKQEKGAV